MKRKIYAGLLMGGILFAQGFSCIGPVPAADAVGGTNGAPIWNLGGSLQAALNALLGN